MATLTASGAGRGRRKQAKPQRKVDADPGPVPEDPPNPSLLGKSPGHRAIVMSPDDNHNEIAETSNDLQKIKHGPIHKEGDVPEEVPEASRLGVIKHVKSGGRPEDLDGDSDKAAIGGDTSEDDDKIIEYMRRSDTAVIFPEQVETHQTSNVPGALNGLKPEPEELSPGQEYFMKCPQCQKGYQTYQGLKDHIESAHGDMLSMENGSVSSNPLSPTTNLSGSGGPYACSQCSASFANKDQLEKHELLHSPNPQVFCKVCNKTFANVYRLQRHMISHDESAVLRKFKCTECDKAFKFKHHLKEHIRIHSGEKPFECGNCGKRFSHSGSYSSHMTSKKCLVMNLKLGRTRAPNTTNLEKSSPSPRGPKRNSLNNNLATSPNQNGMFPILPKYTDAATAAALFNPFYISPPNMPIPPYSIPTIGEFLEKLQRVSPQTSGVNIMENDERKNVEESDGELDKTKSSSCGDLVMDEEEIEVKDEEEEKNNGDLEAVKRILETVNVSVTKQFLQANMQKYSSDTSDCNSVASAQSPQAIFNCNSCRKTFPTQNSLEEHECDSSEVKSEGLAAKLEDALTTKSENDAQNGSFSGNSDEEYEKHHNDEEIDNERVATTDQLSDDGRKVRVRSLISDEQLKVLKDNYAINPRPKREDLTRIAEQIGFPVRVVQVWFQNTRARDRREGRLIQIPYNQPRFPVSQTSQYFPQPTSYSSEQPLDLSIRKDTSRDSSPWSSPRPTSIHHSDSEDVVNLSHKSSRSPTPFQHSSYQNYQNSNCSSELRRSPSPIDFKNGQSRLAQILAQPSHKLPLPGMSLVPMDRLMQFGNQELQNFSQMITNLSPSNKRSWSDDGDATQESADDEMNSKRKVGQLVMKSLGSPMLGNQEEAEGQFGCDQCDKSFSKQSSLARHKYEHSGQRPHKCDECPKAFKHKHHLTEHKRLHSGEKPFQCQKCLKRFSHSGSYSQHMNHRYSYCKPYRE